MRLNLLCIVSIILIFHLHCTSKNLLKTNMKESDNFLQKQPILYCGFEGFTQSESEHIIREINKPFVVTEIKGQIQNETGIWPEGANVIFEIREKDKNSEIKKIHVGKNGNFKIKKIKSGIYCFKATANGWQSVMGVIIVSKESATKNEIEFEMLLGI